MELGDLVTFDESSEIQLWLSPSPEPVDSRGTGVIRGGDLLIVLQEEPVGDYTRVLAPKGTTGWIYAGYLRRTL